MNPNQNKLHKRDSILSWVWYTIFAVVVTLLPQSSNSFELWPIKDNTDSETWIKFQTHPVQFMIARTLEFQINKTLYYSLLWLLVLVHIPTSSLLLFPCHLPFTFSLKGSNADCDYHCYVYFSNFPPLYAHTSIIFFVDRPLLTSAAKNTAVLGPSHCSVFLLY